MGMGWGTQALWYWNWETAVPPVSEPLIIRQDAKGDGHFGAPRSGGRRHRGVDVEAAVGTPVRVIQSGRVVEIGIHRGLGLFLVVEHQAALKSVYAHLNSVDVRVGERLRQGQTIGTVGKSGNARHPWIHPHLHLEVFRNDQPVDPASLGLTLIEPVTQQGPAHDAHANLDD